MGDVVDLRPVDETLEFGATAAYRRDFLLCQMLKAMHKLQAVEVTLGKNAEFEAAHSEIVSLQAERARVDELVETMAGACEAVHDQRTRLGSEMPDGERVILIAANQSRRRAVAFDVEKRGARFLCRNFEIFEITKNGVAAIFDRSAAA
ncbi:MAG: hypothetical protein ABL901_14800 [Hyphomicrobiaceae bacterium]